MWHVVWPQGVPHQHPLSLRFQEQTMNPEGISLQCHGGGTGKIWEQSKQIHINETLLHCTSESWQKVGTDGDSCPCYKVTSYCILKSTYPDVCLPSWRPREALQFTKASATTLRSNHPSLSFLYSIGWLQAICGHTLTESICIESASRPVPAEKP